MEYRTRLSDIRDIPEITSIYNQGIEDRIATLETRLRTEHDMKEWMEGRSDRHKVAVLEDDKGIVRGWASLNVFNSRCCYSGVVDLSIYIERKMRGKGLGKILLDYIIKLGKDQGFHKIVLSTFDTNEQGKGLYRALGFREVGTYMKQGMLDGKFINITIMEKLLIQQF